MPRNAIRERKGFTSVTLRRCARIRRFARISESIRTNRTIKTLAFSMNLFMCYSFHFPTDMSHDIKLEQTRQCRSKRGVRNADPETRAQTTTREYDKFWAKPSTCLETSSVTAMWRNVAQPLRRMLLRRCYVLRGQRSMIEAAEDPMAGYRSHESQTITGTTLPRGSKD